MAIGTPVSVGSGTTATAGLSASFSTSSTISAGDHLILLCGAGAGGAVLSSVSGGSLTWAVKNTVARGTAASMGIAVAHCPSGLASGTSLTITWSISSSRHLVGMYSVSGLASGDPFDAGNATSNASTATPTSGTFTTTQADTIIMAVRSANDATVDAGWTAGTGYTKCPSGTLSQSTAQTLLMEYRILSSTQVGTAATLTQTAIQCAMGASAFKMSLVTPVRSRPVIVQQAVNRSYTY